MHISIIIPTLNEEHCIGKVLKYTLCLKGDFEVVVVDGGSTDATLKLVSTFKSVKLLNATKGRANQMNLGAVHAQGNILLFLHADTFLPTTFHKDILNLMQDPKVTGGSFRLKMDDSHLIFKFYNWCSQFSLEFFTYGDHAMFFSTKAFQHIGGFKTMPFMEDVEIQKRIRQQGKFKKLHTSVLTSNRRFQKNGVIRQLILDTLLVLFFKIGISANSLKRFYPDHSNSIMDAK